MLEQVGHVDAEGEGPEGAGGVEEHDRGEEKEFVIFDTLVKQAEFWLENSERRGKSTESWAFFEPRLYADALVRASDEDKKALREAKEIQLTCILCSMERRKSSVTWKKVNGSANLNNHLSRKHLALFEEYKQRVQAVKRPIDLNSADQEDGHSRAQKSKRRRFGGHGDAEGAGSDSTKDSEAGSSKPTSRGVAAKRGISYPREQKSIASYPAEPDQQKAMISYSPNSEPPRCFELDLSFRICKDLIPTTAADNPYFVRLVLNADGTLTVHNKSSR